MTLTEIEVVANEIWHGKHTNITITIVAVKQDAVVFRHGAGHSISRYTMEMKISALRLYYQKVTSDKHHDKRLQDIRVGYYYVARHGDQKLVVEQIDLARAKSPRYGLVDVTTNQRLFLESRLLDRDYVRWTGRHAALTGALE